MVDALRLITDDGASGDSKLQTKMNVGVFRDQMIKMGKEKGEQLLPTQVEEIVSDCKLEHESEIQIEDFAKFLLSK